MVTLTQDNSAQTGGVTSYIYNGGATFYGYLYNQDSSYLYFDNTNVLNYTMGSGNDALVVEAQPLSTSGNRLNLNGGAGTDYLQGNFSNLTTVMTLTNTSLSSSTLLTATNFERYSLTLGSAADSVTLTNRQSGEYLDGGAGKDSLNIDNSAQSVGVTSNISDNGDGSFTGYLYNSVDYLYFIRFETLTYKMGTGSDIANVNAGPLLVAGNSVSVDAGAGAGVDSLNAELSMLTTSLTMTNSALSGTGVSLTKFEVYNVSLGSGIDTATLSNRTANESINTGSGKDTATVDNSTQTVGVSSSISDGGSGTFDSYLYNRTGNYTHVFGNEVLTYKMGKGDDTLSINGAALATAGNGLTVDGNLGTDTLSSVDLSVVTANLTMTNSGISGTGVAITNFEVYGNVYFGSGNDSLTLTGLGATLGSSDFGNGNDVANLSNRTANDYVYGGVGTDTLLVDNSAQTVGVSSSIANYDGTSFTGSLYNLSGAYTYFTAFESITYKMGTGDDTLSVDGVPLTVAGTSLTLDGGSGTDTLSANLSLTSADLTMTNSSITGIAINISNFDAYGSLYFGSGDDRVTLSAPVSYAGVDLGDGDDIADLSDRSAYESVYGSAGTDALLVDNSDQTVGVSSSISNQDGSSFTGYLYNSSGAYTYFTTVENITYQMGTGDDSLSVDGTPLTAADTSLTLDGGSGTDTLTADLSSTTNDLTLSNSSITGIALNISSFEAYGNLYFGGGDDRVTLTGAVSVGGFDLGDGDDIAGLSDRTAYESVYGSAGTDALLVDNSGQTAGVSSSISNQDGNSFTGYFYNSAGAYTYFTTFENITYKMGTGDDSLSVDGTPLTTADPSLTLDGGLGTDTLSADLSSTTNDLTMTNGLITGIAINISSFEAYGNLYFGSGDDVMTLTGTVAVGSASLGDGNDSLSVTGEAATLSIADLGDGDDIADLTDRTAYESVYGSAGTDALLVDNSNQTVGVSSSISNQDGNSFTGNLYNSGGAYTYFTTFENITYQMGAGDDSLSVNGAPLAAANTSLTLDGGLGTDTLSADLSSTTNDLTLSNSSVVGVDLSITSFEAYGTVYFGSGNDSLTLTGTLLSGADLGMGNDTVTLGNRTSNEGVSGGLGSDNLTVDNSTQTAGVSSSISNYNGSAFSGYLSNLSGYYTSFDSFENITYRMGSGDDLLTVDGAALSASGTSLFVDGGLGYDTVSVSLTSLGSTTITAVGTVLTFGGNTVGGFEQVTLTLGNGSNNVTAGTENDFIYGGTGDETIDGGLGDDLIDGGSGTNTVAYLSATSGVTVSLAVPGSVQDTGGAGFDTLYNFQNLTGSLNSDNLTGNDGNNVIDGRAGADTLAGGIGDDTYYVDNAGDVVNEATGAGNDIVLSSVTFTLAGKQIEHLTLTGSSDINATGNSFNNILNGNSGSNRLDGGANNDTMAGGLGDDTYVISGAGDVVTEAVGAGTDTVESGIAYVLGANVENLILTGSSAVNGTGNSLNNVLTGNSGVNTLTGGAGNDTYYIQNLTDNVVELAAEGIDLIVSTVAYSLSGRQVENLTLTGADSVTATGNDGDNILTGNSGNNLLDGGLGNDTVIGGLGDDTFVVNATTDVVTEGVGEGTDTLQSSATYTLSGNIENLILTGSGNINGVGNTANNVITGNSGNNLMDGGTGSDSLVGGAGDDSYIVDVAGDTVTENNSEGTDTVYSSVSYVLGANLEHLSLMGSGNINGTGNALGNNLIGNLGNNRLDGAAGVNSLFGGAGDDTYVVATVNDSVTEYASEGTDTVESAITYTLGANVENLILTGSANINGTGNTLNNALTGNAGNNVLDGGAGNDTMTGGAGNDTYYVQAAADNVVELSGEGTDLVISTVTYSLAGRQAENLTLTGAAAINATGNGVGNVLTGNTGNNLLDGGTGNDTMVGGLGDDTFVVSATGDVVTEAASAGTDTVQTAVTLALAANVENLVLLSTALNGTGNNLGNVLTGNLSNNLLDGGAGDDSLSGGQGDDSYVVEAAGDVVTEAGSEGTDTVSSSIGYVLSANVENLILTGSANINGTGNGLNNSLIGNADNNRLDGGAGVNSLAGGLGDDTYVVATVNDTVIEAAAQGTDTVESAISYTLGTDVETLVLTGAANTNGTGNTLGNVLTGNSGNNLLDGGSGDDTAIGGLGDDTFVVGSVGDVVTETAAEGTDLVQSAVSWTLAANVENLTLTGSANASGTGNGSNNVIIGNSGNNMLDGLAGNDSLSGGLGDDSYMVDVAGDVVTEAAGEGTDQVVAALSYVLGGNLENLALGGTGNFTATGNSGNNVIVGNIGNNRLDGGAGTNSLSGGAGDDTYVVATLADTVAEAAGDGTDTVEAAITYALGANVENLVLTGAANINGTGTSGNNVLTGNSGNNVLSGGLGNDTYYVQNTSDNVVEANGEGTDTIYSAVTYALTGRFIESLILTGAAAINATGNSLANSLTGNDGANTLTGLGGNDDLDGGLGIDSLIGGLGDDSYGVDNVGDVVTELASEGADTVRASIAYTLGANVENLILLGSGNINGTGNDLNNVLTGNAGTNVLAGGLGDDSYYIQNAADNVSEASNAGTDTIFSSVTYSLAGKQVENLILTGAAALNATGNGLANSLTGNDADNMLDGGTGHDRLNGGLGADNLIGGTGNDTYVVDNAGDVVTEAAGAGTDTVESSITYILAANAENLTLTGTASLNGTGNDVSNVLTGNSGSNVLTGGLGNDTYYVQNTGDNVVENGGEGADVIFSTVTYNLNGRYAETINLMGTAAINATGNSLANTLSGNDGINILNGKGGADILTGGLGADIFLFESGSGKDTITDFSAAQNDSVDIHAYTGGVANAGLVVQVGLNVVITLSAANIITINNAAQADVLSHMVW